MDEAEARRLFDAVHVCESEGIEWGEFKDYVVSHGGLIHVCESHYHFANTTAS